MRHANKNRTLSRTRSQRTALLRNLAVSLIENERIVTTTAKAKELRPLAERLITYGKRQTVAGRRFASSALGEPNPDVIKKLFGPIAERFKERAGGYTRIIKMGDTKSGQDRAVIELV